MKTKQLMAALFALLLAATIVPTAFAHDGLDDGVLGDTRITASTNTTINSSLRERLRLEQIQLEEERRDAFEALNEQRRTEFDALRDEQRTGIDTLRSAIRERREQALQNLREDRESIRQRLEDRREHLKELRVEFKDHRADIKNASENVREECRENPRSDACVSARANFSQEGQAFLGNAVDQILTHIQNYQDRIDANQYIDNESAIDMNAQLAASASALTDLQARIDAANQTDINATKELAADLRAEWKLAHMRLRLADGLLWLGRFGEFLNHADAMADRFDQARDQLVADGKNVTGLDDAISSFRGHIESANDQFVVVMQEYTDGLSNVTTNEQVSERISTAKDGLKDARDDLSEAREDVRTIVRLIRGADSTLFAGMSADINARAHASASLENDATGDDAEVDGDANVTGTVNT